MPKLTAEALKEKVLEPQDTFGIKIITLKNGEVYFGPEANHRRIAEKLNIAQEDIVHAADIDNYFSDELRVYNKGDSMEGFRNTQEGILMTLAYLRALLDELGITDLEIVAKEI